MVGAGRRCDRGALAHCLADLFKVAHWYQAARVVKRIARLVPLGVVFAPGYVEEVARGKGQESDVRVVVGSVPVVQGLDDLFRRDNGGGVFLGDGETVVMRRGAPAASSEFDHYFGD